MSAFLFKYFNELGRSSFAPTDIPDYRAWYTAKRGLSLTGTSVTQWDDQSGRDIHLLQGSAGNQPTYDATGLNSRPTVTFTDDWMGSSADLGAVSDEETVFFVVNYVDGGGL